MLPSEKKGSRDDPKRDEKKMREGEKKEKNLKEKRTQEAPQRDSADSAISHLGRDFSIPSPVICLESYPILSSIYSFLNPSIHLSIHPSIRPSIFHYMRSTVHHIFACLI